MNINQKELIIQVKFGLNQPAMFVPTTIIGHVAYYCNHVVSSPDENNNIKKVYKIISEWYQFGYHFILTICNVPCGSVNFGFFQMMGLQLLLRLAVTISTQPALP